MAVSCPCACHRLSKYAADNPTQLLSPALAVDRRQDPLQHLSGSGEELGCAGAQSNSFLLLYSSLGLPLFLLLSIFWFFLSNSTSFLSTAIIPGVSPACVAALFFLL